MNVGAAVIFILLGIIVLVGNFLIISAFVWFICWGFNYPFSWPLVVGLWASFALLRYLFRKVRS